ncbi:ead/Ea22-like family protein [Atlantibacter hermannii]|uniref:ead/Ea22-like family protein n=1 Tax=Atlantibacter hermannii TaxID=565 RepID=UPI0034D3EC1B
MSMTAEQLAQLREVAERAASDDWGYDRDEFCESLTPGMILSLLDELERKDKRIAELEARTVTLIEPPRYDCEGYHIDEAYLTPASDGECYDREEALTAFKSACAAAGINLTVEG